MPSFYRSTLISACLLLALATALGAYASHGLDAVLDPPALATFTTAVSYQFFHALGLLGLALVIDRHPRSRAFKLAAGLVFAGVLLFSGGLVAASFDGPRAIRMLAPVGGVALISAWLIGAFGALRLTQSD